MSPASKSKSKDKKAGKEPPKTSSKPAGHANSGGGISSSGYNPLLGTFHTLETAPASSATAVHVNGRFRNIDETDDHMGNSFGPGLEYDSVSNNDSWSGESEDHKEKVPHPPPRQEAVPGADNDKREKIRQKNEKKHQRQKERRAQELHERCSGYLMSRKLEALGQQLVAMGFSQERATMALILNEGRVEESVAWLFEGGEEVDKGKEHNFGGGGNLKIDISEELARIADMEVRYKCSKQEVERAVVSSEGDLEKAEETLRTPKQEPPAVPPKPEETGDPPAVGNGKLPVAINQNSVRIQSKPSSSTIILQKRDEKDFNYTKVAATTGSSVDSKSMQSLKRTQPKTEWVKPHLMAAPAGWPGAGNPSVSYSLASPLQASPPQAMTEARYLAVGNELKNLQLGSVRGEPVVMMQRPQSVNTKQIPTSNVSSSPSGTAASWYPSNVDTVKPNGFIKGTKSMSPNTVSMNQMHNQLNYQQQQQFVSSSGSVESSLPSRSIRTRTSPTLAAASSLGLFSGLGANCSSGSSSPVDWNTGGSMLQLDYANIDWSLDRGSSMSRPGSLWPGVNSFMQNGNLTYDSYTSGLGVKTAMRPVLPNGSSIPIPGLQEGVGKAETSAGGSREWTSPFEENDIFSLPRQFVSSPSL